ncbi:hypothetical protein BCR39DRAFT_514175 [Naematelia encephala]|uniref:Uncharacterized protein n=1 Tax=Naematelia encephala TaxID=71784 RepID=A0A1Y2BKV5_9TREE|nr:hypothetical protein BCR39DRAFT_514175 [Naematelia encephala]
MPPFLHPSRYLTLRKSIHALPRMIKASQLPCRFVRPITIQAGPTTSPDRHDPGSFQLVDDPPPSSSNSYSASSSQSQPSSSTSSSSSGRIPNPRERDLAEHRDLDSDTDTAISVVPPRRSEDRWTTIPPVPPLDTYGLIQFFQSHGFDRNTSLVLVDVLKALMEWRRKQLMETLSSRSDLGEGNVHFRAELARTRADLLSSIRKDNIWLQSMAGQIKRDLEALDDKIKEDVGTLRHDIEMELNNRKTDNRSEIKQFDLAIEDINNKCTIAIGEMKTEIEQTKWDATRRAISVIILIVVSGIAITSYNSRPKKSAIAKAVSPVQKEPPPAMQDVAAGDDEDIWTGADTEEKLEKILSDSVGKVEIPVRRSEGKPKREERGVLRSGSRGDLDVDHIGRI